MQQGKQLLPLRFKLPCAYALASEREHPFLSYLYKNTNACATQQMQQGQMSSKGYAKRHKFISFLFVYQKNTKSNRCSFFLYTGYERKAKADARVDIKPFNLLP
jgi:hypothetical protein